MIDELVKKFHSNDCSRGERARIANYFLEHPDELDQYFSEKDWARFNSDQIFDKERSEQLLESIHSQIRTRQFISPWQKLSLVAAVLIFISFGLTYLILRHAPEKQLITIYKPSPYKQYLVTNISDTIKKITLPDGSIVQLTPGSEIRYDQSYNVKRRELAVVGQADFKVHKDAARPFIVRNDKVSATALGTRFTVTALKESKLITVNLHEGKLLVKKATPNNDQPERYYLYPGDKFLYDKIKNVTQLIKKHSHPKLPDAADLSSNEHITNWYMFEDQSLTQVFDQLQVIYDVNIKCERSVINNIRFIGRIESTDTLGTILSDIARTNQLKIVKKGNTFFISRDK